MKLTNRQKAFITKYMNKKSINEIAESLNVGSKLVQRFIKTIKQDK